MSETQQAVTGCLYIVATPIGNLGDISARALEILGSVDVIAAEDTRHTRRLLQHFAIGTPLLSLHEYNERERHLKLVERVASGERIALVSDAGTPLISDPGFVLVRAARQQGLSVVPVPGPCAIVAALSAAGLPTDRFTFEGFLPGKRKARRDALEALRHESRTLVFYESPHRIAGTLSEAADVFGADRQAVLARELTKTFETFLSGGLGELVAALEADSNAGRGEMVLMIAGAASGRRDEGEDGGQWIEQDRLLDVLQREVGVKTAARLAAEITGLARNRLYQRALALAGEGPPE